MTIFDEGAPVWQLDYCSRGVWQIIDKRCAPVEVLVLDIAKEKAPCLKEKVDNFCQGGAPGPTREGGRALS